jgi:hypothetical protein
MGKMIGGEAGKSLFTSILKQALSEGLVEEMPQSAVEQFVQNVSAKTTYDPERGLFKDVGEAAVGGALAGMAMGGGMAVPAHIMGAGEPGGPGPGDKRSIDMFGGGGEPPTPEIQERNRKLGLAVQFLGGIRSRMERGEVGPEDVHAILQDPRVQQLELAGAVEEYRKEFGIPTMADLQAGQAEEAQRLGSLGLRLPERRGEESATAFEEDFAEPQKPQAGRLLSERLAAEAEESRTEVFGGLAP